MHWLQAQNPGARSRAGEDDQVPNLQDHVPRPGHQGATSGVASARAASAANATKPFGRPRHRGTCRTIVTRRATRIATTAARFG